MKSVTRIMGLRVPLASEARIGVRHEGRVAEWFKAPVLKTGRGFTLPRGFESHPFRQTKFGKKLDQKDQNWIVSSASVPRHYLSKGCYKCSDYCDLGAKC